MITRFWGKIAAFVLFCLLSACAQKPEIEPSRLKLQPMAFSSLKGWGQDQQGEVITAFRKSCAVFEKKDPDTAFVLEEAGRVEDWLEVCSKAKDIDEQNNEEARRFFETFFVPHRVESEEKGLFTGYYEASLRGSWTQGGPYQTPLWSRPDDMLRIDLGAFRKEWSGQKITGKIEKTSFVPYDNRSKIARGSLNGRAKPLLWVDDPISAFFLEIQGSGQIQMDDGQIIRVGYAAQNGHGYTAIGRVLLDRGEIERPVTMQKIRAWLQSRPDKAQEIMDTNPSFVFFQRSDKDGAVGAQGVTLTPMRSMAIDPAFVPLGIPLWLQAEGIERLVIAQDTGGAIKGPVRGDLFTGAGEQAENLAGHMQSGGTYVLLLPRKRATP
jgi:membrane-bound lytic murein transglycosylase A